MACNPESSLPVLPEHIVIVIVIPSSLPPGSTAPPPPPTPTLVMSSLLYPPLTGDPVRLWSAIPWPSASTAHTRSTTFRDSSPQFHEVSAERSQSRSRVNGTGFGLRPGCPILLPVRGRQPIRSTNRRLPPGDVVSSAGILRPVAQQRAQGSCPAAVVRVVDEGVCRAWA